MNWKQFYYVAGIGSEYRVVFRKSGLVREHLILTSIGENILYFRENPGTFFQLTEEDDVEIIQIKGGYQEKPIQDKVEEIKRKCNKIGNHPGVLKLFSNQIQEATEILKNSGNRSADRLIDILNSETVIREHRIRTDEINALIETAGKYLGENPEVCSIVMFLIHFAANSYSGAVKVMTDQLTPDCDSSVYRMLGQVNLYLGKAEAMYLYWMGKYFLQSPEKILMDNECGCDSEWIRYLDICGNLICYKNLETIIGKLMELGKEGCKCAYLSLTRLFQRAGFFSLACEAASYFVDSRENNAVGRTADELVRYLRTDEDSYCCYAMKAADTILSDGLEDYSRQNKDDRLGYLYDYAVGRHYGRILGYDLLTYFFAASTIPESRRKQFNRNYDFSSYQRERPLSAPVRFRAGNSFNHGSFAIETFY